MKQLSPAIFWVGCLGTRLAIALLILLSASSTLLSTTLIVFSLGIAISIIVIWIFKLRKTGFEAGGLIWWNALRPIHGALWALAAWFIFKKNHALASLLIVADVALAVWARLYWKPYVLQQIK